jgi:hypothetical protein
MPSDKYGCEGSYHGVACGAASATYLLSPAGLQGMLRTREVMERLKTVSPQPGQKPPILVYLGVLLQKGKLNAQESTELARWAVMSAPSSATLTHYKTESR